MTDTVPSSAVSRRSFIGRSAAAGLGVALVGSVDTLFGADPATAAGAESAAGIGYGTLQPDPNGILALPRGFSYKIVAETGVTELDGGGLTPSSPDGTASFLRPGGNGSVLVNNHELSGDEAFAVPHRPGFVYDDQAIGGTTTIVVDGTGERVREYVSLAGTVRNCAGGRTPWETWLSCEETEDVLGKPHGYVFEVDPHDQEANHNPQPIKAFGRYAHESVVVDPDEGRVYLTEDANTPNGLLYRFTPPPSALPLGKGSFRRLQDKAGQLQALKAYDSRGRFVEDLSVAIAPGTTYRTTWVGVPDRDATTTSTRMQFGPGEITRSHKLEGMWWGDGGAYFVASYARHDDGSVQQHDGQVWFLDPVADTIELKLRFGYTRSDQDGNPDGPDNISVSPYGGVIMAEDGEGKQHLLGATPSGKTFFFARNEFGEDEFTGPNFSRDKKTLFANIQTPGFVFAITGPFVRQV